MSSSSAAGEAPESPTGVNDGRRGAAYEEYDARMKRCAQEMFEVAETFLFGRNGVEKDLAKGAELLKAAGHGGHAEAQNMLGSFYHYAKMGFPKDFEEAAKWWRRAVDQGDAEGQWALGNCYLDGDGVGKDEVEAARLFRLSAEQRFANGQCSLGYCYDHGVGVDQDFEEAVKWYRLAVEQGNADAQNNLGACYHDGEGVEQDYAEAARLFQLAADQGRKMAQKHLGLLYFKGNGVQRNCDTALRWLRLSGNSDEDVTDAIAEIENSATLLLGKTPDTQASMIEAGESVFGQAQDGTGDFALHVAARTLQLDTVALFFDHAAFDDLVLRANTANVLPRDVVSTQKPLKAQTREARALRSILSMSRRSRAACVLWCFEVLRDVAPERLIACIPRDIVREVVQRLLPPAAPGNVHCSVSSLMISPSVWLRPCLAIAPPVVPQPTSPQEVLAQQQHQQHLSFALSSDASAALPERGTKRALDERVQDVDAVDDGSQGEAEGVAPASKRSRH